MEKLKSCPFCGHSRNLSIEDAGGVDRYVNGEPSPSGTGGTVCAMPTDDERAEIARIIGWLEGFSPSVWLLIELCNKKGVPIISDTVCAEYDEKVKRLWSLVMGGEGGVRDAD